MKPPPWYRLSFLGWRNVGAVELERLWREHVREWRCGGWYGGGGKHGRREVTREFRAERRRAMQRARREPEHGPGWMPF